MSLRKRPLIEGWSGSFVKMLSINEVLFAVILVRRVSSGKTSFSTTNLRNHLSLYDNDG